jgi:hypothetical protein
MKQIKEHLFDDIRIHSEGFEYGIIEDWLGDDHFGIPIQAWYKLIDYFIDENNQKVWICEEIEG